MSSTKKKEKKPVAGAFFRTKMFCSMYLFI